jgi:thiol peroxidase
MASDHRDVSFGTAYGVLMKELRLFCRAAFVVSAAGEVTYSEYMEDAGDLPDLDAIVEAAKAASTANA